MQNSDVPACLSAKLQQGILHLSAIFINFVVKQFSFGSQVSGTYFVMQMANT